MKHPPPHSFSRSPVEEVLCCCTCGSGAGQLSRAFPPPYPGWPHIREGIGEMIAGAAGETSRVTGCLLRYTDLIPGVDDRNVPGTGEIERLLSARFGCHSDVNRDEIILVSTDVPGTTGSVRSIRDRPGKPGWTLVFTMKTARPDGFVSRESVLDWFDDARAGIHELFDIIVPMEIVQELR